MPYTWGSAEIEAKRAYLLQHKVNINTIFIGSSKTHNQIIAKIFDSSALSNQINIKSFNFGISGLLPMESLYIYKRLIQSDSLQFKYVFLELDWIETINTENLNSIRSYYWLNTPNYIASMRTLSASSLSPSRKLWGHFHYSLDYLQNSLNVGKISEYIKLTRHSNDAQIGDTLSKFAGYFPLFRSMHSSEISMYQEVKSSASTSIKHYDQLKNGPLSEPYLRVLKEILAISKLKGIDLFFVVPLQWKYFQYQELIPIIHSIGDSRVISLFNIDEYSELYNKKNFADPNHLNDSGAYFYTLSLFDEFMRKTKYTHKKID